MINKFKGIKFVRCINNYSIMSMHNSYLVRGLTKGKIYKVVVLNGSTMLVKHDHGSIIERFNSRFEPFSMLSVEMPVIPNTIVRNGVISHET